MTYKECYQYGREILQKAEVPEADLDARLLLEYVCNTSRNDLLVHGDKEVESALWEQYKMLIAKRESRIPLQHITGVQEFCGLTFAVNEHVLIPRQDTEILVEQALKRMAPGMKVLDMCTGSGCILISLLSLCQGVSGVGADISDKALKVARENGVSILSIQDGTDKDAKLTWVQSDLFENIEGSFDVIVSNPPYIKTAVIEELMPEVKVFEPMGALDGMEDGLFFYRKIVEKSISYLNKNGWLLFEIGHDQGEEVSTLMADAGYEDIKVVKDYAGFDRVVLGRLG